MTVKELRAQLDTKGIKWTTRMRKPELEKLLADANEAELVNMDSITKLEDLPEFRHPRYSRYEGLVGAGPISSVRNFRRRQPEERDRQKRQRKMKRYLRSIGKDVSMNPGTRKRK